MNSRLAGLPAVLLLPFLLLAPACSSTAASGSDAGPPDGSTADVSIDVPEPDVHPTVEVTMNAYTPGGTGGNTSETYLNVTNVNSAKFGKLFERAVDGDVYAQPLYMGALTMPQDNKTHNVVFVATEHDSVFAFDADDPTATKPLWKVSVGTSTPLPSPYLSFEWATNPPNCSSFAMRESGITATPVIDPKTGTIYVVALNIDATHTTPGGTCLDLATCATQTCDEPTISLQLHALDLLTGAEKFGGPVDVEASVSGSGAGSESGTLTFDPKLELARMSLLLNNGKVYFGTASYNDAGNYHGWLFAYDATSLKQVGKFCDTPNGTGGGIWQSGRGMIADESGGLYVVTGQGSFTANAAGSDFGDSVLKMSSDLSSVDDYFTQFLSDYQKNNFPNEWDDDLGSAGATLIPGTSLILASGKLGNSYLLDTSNLGKWSPTGDNIVQKLRLTWRPGTTCVGGMHALEAQVFGTPVAWVGPSGTHVYVWANSDYLRDYLLDGSGKLQDSGQLCWCDPWVVSNNGADLDINVSDPNCATPNSEGTFEGGGTSQGSALALSSYGSENGTGILWATYAIPSGSGPINANTSTAVGALAAFDATNVHAPIWASTGKTSDALGNWAKWTPPTIANGKVYVATFSNQLVVYGLVDP